MVAKRVFEYFRSSIRGKGLFGKKPAADPVPFKEIFGRFRRVLEVHNSALEVIADMGDKLGGDYLFDINYIRGTYDELHRLLSDSLSAFDSLTEGRYHLLRDAFLRIDSEVRRLIYGSAAQEGRLVIPHEDIPWSMVHEVGGKNANLADIKRNLGSSVPGAFAVTTHAFGEYMRFNRIDEKIALLGKDAAADGALLEEIRELIIGGTVPPRLGNALEGAVSRIRSKCGGRCFVAVRSSAEEEDSGYSFAGQFETVLNVPAEPGAVEEAYKAVIASLFSERAAAYHRQSGHDIREMKMAVCCMLMVDAAASGVLYSADPNGGGDRMLINAAWGLGKAVVEGRTGADFYAVKKDRSPAIIEKRIGEKTSAVIGLKEGGVRTVVNSPEIAGRGSLTDGQALELAAQALQIENYFRQPQDIEWAFDESGKLFILQARPLRIAEDSRRTASGPQQSAPENCIAELTGSVVQKGAGAGRIFIFRNKDELESFPKGAVLVARHDSSDFIRIMPYAAAIVTDIGTPTSHMSSLCREFRVPTIVNTGNATQILQHGQEVTLYADDEDRAVVCEGLLRDILERAGTADAIKDVYEFRKRRYVLRYISPLNLIDPLQDNFTPEGCRTLHDILRFIHEKSVMELIERARRGMQEHTVRLELPIPAGITMVDIGGGLAAEEAGPQGAGEKTAKHDRVGFGQIASVPFRAVLGGMMHPGAWHSEAVSLQANDFFSSMMRMPDIVVGGDEYAASNVAVISRDYVNLNLRFGYHFTVLDCYCSELPRNNHLYFRFAGGATDMVKRSRRIQLIGIVLKSYGFSVEVKGDLIIGRLSNIGKDELEQVLDKMGRLTAYTRQLDAALHDESRVEEYAKKFLEGNYEV